MITEKNLLAHELIGLNARIADSKDKAKVGTSGKIVDETKNLIVMETAKGEKKFAKKESVFEFKICGKKVFVNGKLLEARPEDRIKQFAKKYKKYFN